MGDRRIHVTPHLDGPVYSTRKYGLWVDRTTSLHAPHAIELVLSTTIVSFPWTNTGSEFFNLLGKLLMGRKPWTDRLTVEQCCRLSISELVRAGAFQADLGTWSTCRWIDRNGKQVRIALFRLLRDDDGGLILHFQQAVARAMSSSPIPYDQSVRITRTRCNLGGWQPWFHCPNLTNGSACRCRVRHLYMLPGGVRLGCRACFNLTYSSSQCHDARLDRMLRLPIEQFRKALTSNDRGIGTLGIRIGAVLRRRMEKRALRRRPRGKRTSRRPNLSIQNAPMRGL